MQTTLAIPLSSMLDTHAVAQLACLRTETQWRNAQHKEFQAMYEACSTLSLSALLTTRQQILADWDEVGREESQLQLRVIECRIDKVRTITQKCGCPDPVPGHVRLDRRTV